MPIFFTIITYEILLNFRNLGKILANFLFFIISFSLCFLIAQNNETNNNFYHLSLIWISLIFCLVFSSVEFLKKDFDDGSIEQLIISLENFEVFILAKMLGNWISSALPIIVITPLLGKIINLNQTEINQFLILIILASLIVNFICTFCGSLSVLGNSAPMIAVIAMPLIIPILLIAFSGNLNSSENFQSSLRILIGLVVFIGSISVFATSKIVKIAAE
ncbi:MAG: hypothetical protein FJ368_01045 [Pelagibacterales bacterium]|nr:hypothetical protein [Pelagibacterales bacterium]